MARKRYVLLSLVTRKKLSEEPFGRKMLSLFYEKYPMLAPEYANFYEPINKPIRNTEEALEYWSEETFICRRRKTVVMFGDIGIDRSNEGGVQFECNWSSNINWLELFQDLAIICEAYFGYIHVFTDREIEPAAAGSAIGCFTRGTPGIHLKKGIPNLGWANYFGEEYVKEIDPKLLKQHGFPVQKMGEGYVFQVTENIKDVIDDYDHFDERRKELKSLFRTDLFQKYEAYG